MLPKVNFINISQNTELKMLYHFLFEDKWGWNERIIKIHPKIKDVYLLKNKKDRITFLKKYIVDFNKSHKTMIESKKKKYQKSWRRIEKDYFQTISQILNTDWPTNRKHIYAMLSINPICPRFLNTWSFDLFYNYKTGIEVIMHESCHFLYFKKWHELYPKAEKKTFNDPYIEWHLSEVVTPIILNDKRIQRLLKKKAGFYKEHQRLKIDQKNVPQYFTGLYRKHINKENGFEIFLRKAYKVINKNKKLFESI
jgi:hypothetical protein